MMKERILKMNQKIARRISIVPTTHCNLKCKLCSNHLYGLVKREHFPAENVCFDIDQCFLLFDTVDWFQFVGGEVFLHPNFSDILGHSLQYLDRVNKIIIESNAARGPNEKEQEILKKMGQKLKVMISDYGPLSTGCKEFVAFMEENDLEYSLKKYHGEKQHFDGWIDATKPRYLEEPGDVLEVMSKNCPQTIMNNMHCCDGLLHRCSNSCFIGRTDLYPAKTGDFVDLRDDAISLAEKQKIVDDFYKFARRSCAYCRWKYCGVLQRYPAAEQLT